VDATKYNIMRTYSQIKTAVESLGFKWFKSPLSINYVWERTNFVATNKMTDFLHVCWLDENNKENILSIPGTTKPGLVGSLLSPVTVRGVTGTAVIRSPQQVLGGWEFRDTDKEFSHYPYFRQVAPVDYWRDGDKDKEIDKVNPEEDKINGTHWHIMSKIDTYGSGNVNNWSLGCSGAAEPEFEKILPITRLSCKKYGNKVTGTYIESQHIK